MIVCVDCFEHFADPRGDSDADAPVLRPGGKVLVSFGPPWRHPLGGHVYSVFPFAHLVFPESCVGAVAVDVQDRRGADDRGERAQQDDSEALSQSGRGEPFEFERFEACRLRRVRSPGGRRKKSRRGGPRSPLPR